MRIKEALIAVHRPPPALPAVPPPGLAASGASDQAQPSVVPVACQAKPPVVPVACQAQPPVVPVACQAPPVVPVACQAQPPLVPVMKAAPIAKSPPPDLPEGDDQGRTDTNQGHTNHQADDQGHQGDGQDWHGGWWSRNDWHGGS